AMGNSEADLRNGYPGYSLFNLAHGEVPDRNVLVEYHGMGSTTGAFMIRHGKYKYINYADYPAQLFDLEQGPEELHDLAADPRHANALEACRQRLYLVCDPEDVDRQAKARQRELLRESGGREAVIARGDLGFTPVPGSAPVFD